MPLAISVVIWYGVEAINGRFAVEEGDILIPFVPSVQVGFT